MIVSHKHKFIFLRTEKTASTSLTSALTEILGEEDVVYKTFSGAWKKFLPISPGGLKRIAPVIFGLHPHATARDARMILGAKIFDSYYKFSIERNPWDRQLSLYSHRISKEEKHKTLTNFDQDMKNVFWRNLRHTYLNNWSVYSIGNRVVADRVLEYSNLKTDFTSMLAEIGITQEVSLPHFRQSPSGIRKHYSEYYSSKTRDLVADWYRREINEFGYKFQGDVKR